MKEQSETFDVLFSLFFHTDETVDLLGEKSASNSAFKRFHVASHDQRLEWFRGRDTWIETFVE